MAIFSMSSTGKNGFARSYAPNDPLTDALPSGLMPQSVA
jgi:hypothetical protein